MSENRKSAALILADGTVYRGVSFGAAGTVFGEIVFTTGVSGFQETLTDPSNFGQIVVQTFPSVGGYGVNKDDYASDRCHLSGYVVRSVTELPSNYKMTETLGQFVTEQGVVGIEDVDTRAITRHIRDFGSMNAMISTEHLEPTAEVLEQIRSWKMEKAVESVVSAGGEYPAAEEKKHVCMVDFGRRNGSVAALNHYGIGVTVLPCTTPAEELLAVKCDGYVLSEGPGDPAACEKYLSAVKALMESGRPVLGLGLGHQLMALSQGAACEKLLHGHRGANQPVKNLETGHVYVTTQNHSYAVKADSLPAFAKVTEKNLNDDTTAAIVYDGMPAFSVQYNPESVVGGRDKGAVYRRFMELMSTGRN